MANEREQWRSGEVLAFTEREGPGRPPAGPSVWSTGMLASVLAVTFVGMMSSDTLCPEHRVWVELLAGFAIFGVGAALIALSRGWAGAPLLTMMASAAGVAIGFLDAVHSPTRGRLVALSFALCTMLAASMAWRARRLAGWDRASSAASAIEDEFTVAVSPTVDSVSVTSTDQEVATPR